MGACLHPTRVSAVSPTRLFRSLFIVVIVLVVVMSGIGIIVELGDDARLYPLGVKVTAH